MESVNGTGSVEFAKALCEVQGKLETIKKTKTNPFFKSKYAPLDVVWDTIRAVLAKNGFCVIQTTDILPSGQSVLVTELLHTSGQSRKGIYPLNPIKPDPQGLGSAVTYARRYALQAAVGATVEEEDEDGQTAAKKAKVKEKIEETMKTSTHVDDQGNEFTAESVVFTPEEVKKDGNRWGVRSPAGDWYGTFFDHIGKTAKEAKEKNAQLFVLYHVKGKFRNILELRIHEGAVV